MQKMIALNRNISITMNPRTLARDIHKKADRHEHTRDRHLVVSELDPIKILHAQTVRRDQTIECEDLVHLDRSDEGAATLSNDMGD
jgi:hypothetical protein